MEIFIVMKDPLVSVIITSYNKAEMLKQAICSVIAQTYRNWECLVVDDHSTDGAWETAAEMQNSIDDRIATLTTDLGPHEKPEKLNRYAHNINYAVTKFSKGELVTYLCDDDLYSPIRLQTMVSYLEQNPEAKIVCGEQLAFGYGKVIHRKVHPVIWRAAMKVDHSSVMHYRNCFDENGGWDESAESIQCGDAYFWRKLNKHWPFHGIGGILDYHRFNDQSVNAEANKKVLGVAT
jgi:spore maturation protein CgeD